MVTAAAANEWLQRSGDVLLGILDAGSFAIINIGATGTDFDSSGGLTLADRLTVNGTGPHTFAGPVKVSSDVTGAFQYDVAATTGERAILRYLNQGAQKFVITANQSGDDVIFYTGTGSAGSETFTEVLRFLNASGDIQIASARILQWATDTKLKRVSAGELTLNDNKVWTEANFVKPFSLTDDLSDIDTYTASANATNAGDPPKVLLDITGAGQLLVGQISGLNKGAVTMIVDGTSNSLSSVGIGEDINTCVLPPVEFSTSLKIQWAQPASAPYSAGGIAYVKQ